MACIRNVFLLEELQEQIYNSRIYGWEYGQEFYYSLYIIDELQPVMRGNMRSSGIPIMLKVLAALNFYGRSSYQQNIGKNHVLGMSQPSISRCISEVTQAINNHLMVEWIKFPTVNVTRQMFRVVVAH